MLQHGVVAGLVGLAGNAVAHLAGVLVLGHFFGPDHPRGVAGTGRGHGVVERPGKGLRQLDGRRGAEEEFLLQIRFAEGAGGRVEASLLSAAWCQSGPERPEDAGAQGETTT